MLFSQLLLPTARQSLWSAVSVQVTRLYHTTTYSTGKRPNDNLLDGALPGSAMAMSDSGWTNSSIFLTYMKDHFLKYVARPDKDQPLWLIMDGHASHCTIEAIEWARQNNIILFILPPHTSHALQPLDVGCFGPFKSVYYAECSRFIGQERGRVITKYNYSRHFWTGVHEDNDPCKHNIRL